MIWCLWNVYSEPGLPQMVEAADRALPARAHVFVDGKYPAYPGDSELSEDGTAEFCRDAGVYVAAPVDECAKRSAGLREIDARAADGDWVLVLDADEQLLSLALPETDIGVVSFARVSDAETYRRARLYRWRPGYEFRHRHYDLYLGDTHVATLERGIGGSSLVGVGIHHDVRPAERDRAKRIYYRHLAEVET